MDEAKAKQILLDMSCVADKAYLDCGSPFIAWPSLECVPEEVMLDGVFTADQLEAIAWWMRHAGNV